MPEILNKKRSIRTSSRSVPTPPPIADDLGPKAPIRRILQKGGGSSTGRTQSPSRVSREGRPPNQTKTSIRSGKMGFLSKLGDIAKGIGRVATSFIPGPLDDIALEAGIRGVEAITGGGGGRDRSRIPTPAQVARRSPGPRRLVRRGSSRNFIGGTPPLGVPQGVGLPDIPNVPDLRDAFQILQGQDPTTDAGQEQVRTVAPQTGMSSNGTLARELDELGFPNRLVLPAGQKTIATAPKGYVVVTMPDGSKKAVLKTIARKLGLWKSRSKPPISASDWKKLKAAERVKKKAKKIGKTAGFKVTKK